MIIDSHQHLWQLDTPFNYRWLQEPQHAPICRDYLPADLKENMDQAAVAGAVVVQTQHDRQENRWALGLADANSFLLGVVGWVDLACPSVEEQLLEFVEHPKFVGVRHITQDEPDDDFIVREDILRGLKVLQRHQVPFDLLFYPKHLKHADTLARLLPELPMVIDHLSKPKIKAGEIDQWQADLKAAAQHSNMYCKLSGMVTEADWGAWTANDLKPYVETALEYFGAERCMFGSDWPVCELAASYQQVFEALAQTTANLSESERTAILGGTATRFYDLQVPE